MIAALIMVAYAYISGMSKTIQGSGRERKRREELIMVLMYGCRMSDAILLTRAGANTTRGVICQGAGVVC